MKTAKINVALKKLKAKPKKVAKRKPNPGYMRRDLKAVE